MYDGVVVQIHVFLTSALVRGEWTASRPGRFICGERTPATHWMGGLVGPRAGLNDIERRKILLLQILELRPFGRPARRQSLYRLRYLNSFLGSTIIWMRIQKDKLKIKLWTIFTAKLNIKWNWTVGWAKICESEWSCVVWLWLNVKSFDMSWPEHFMTFLIVCHRSHGWVY
jgi:hypothetical protein